MTTLSIPPIPDNSNYLTFAYLSIPLSQSIATKQKSSPATTVAAKFFTSQAPICCCPAPSKEIRYPLPTSLKGPAANVQPKIFTHYKRPEEVPFNFPTEGPLWSATTDLISLYKRISKASQISTPKKTPDLPKIPRKTKQRFIYSVSPVGHGGYGVVYEVKDQLAGGRDYVMKVNNFNRKDSLQQLLDERAAYSLWEGIPHTFKLQTSCWIEKGKTLGLLMNRLPRNLGTRLQEDKGLSFKEVLSLARQLLEVHQASSAKGLFYGDYKENNICFEGGELTVFDFGMSRKISEIQKGYLYAVGRYLSPECYLRELLGPSQDLWIMGCMICAALTEKYLFTTDDFEAHAKEIVQKLGPPPDRFLKAELFKYRNETIPPENRWKARVIQKCKEQNIPPIATQLFIQLLSSMLAYENRIEATDALWLCEQIEQCLTPPKAPLSDYTTSDTIPINHDDDPLEELSIHFTSNL